MRTTLAMDEPARGEKENAMSTLAKKTRATVIPCLRYRDAPGAIEWLCQAFGFEKQLVVPPVEHRHLRPLGYVIR
jgi:hypothetical protein